MQPDLPPGQEHAHHQHPQGKEPQGQGHQREVRCGSFIGCKDHATTSDSVTLVALYFFFYAQERLSCHS